MTSFLILEGDVLEQFKEIDSNCIDAIPTDPPYNIGMDKWDKWPTNQLFGDWCFEWGKEAFRVLKPGGTIFVFGSSRTYHWMACALEKAGFTTIDMIEWVYWGTMPRKSKLKSCHEPIYVGSKGKHRGFNTEELRIPFDKKIKQVAETILLPNIPEGKHPGRSAYAGTTKTKKYKNALDDKPYQLNENGRHPYNVITYEVLNND